MRDGGGVAWAGCRRKKEAREVHKRSEFAQKVHGLRAKLHNQKRFKEKVQMKKTYVRVRRWRWGSTRGRLHQGACGVPSPLAA